MVLHISLPNTQHYKVLSRVKWSHPGKGVAPFPAPRCCSYWKRSLQVALDYSRQHYFYFILPCSIPATTLKDICLQPVSVHLLARFYQASLWLLRSPQRDHWVCSTFVLCMESNALKNSKNRCVASRFFARTPKIWGIVRICNFVDRFPRKPFWFFQRIFPISWSMLLSSRAL